MAKEKNKKRPELSADLFPVVGIGASAGGLDAFKKLLKAIPEKSGMAYVLVQHLDPKHESMLPEILQKVTKIPLSEISDDVKVEPNHIYIIPSNKMLLATDGVLQLSPRPSRNKNERNLPIDLFFESLADVHQSHAIGVVLSGTASDGTRGLKAIKDHGGLTFAQDIASAQYDGMPGSAADAGVVDFILPPEEIPMKLMDLMGQINKGDEKIRDFPDHNDEVFKQILALLRIRKGNDFTYYKQTTISRRILRRMALNKNDEPGAYLKFLRENKNEQDVLYQDLLIPVTTFFRDQKTFANLCDTILPAIIKSKAPGEQLRVWVAGCSTGEEAFSLAICIKEFLSKADQSNIEDKKTANEIRVQIFATDISEPAIAKARKGIYSKSDIEGLSTERIREFFIKMNGSYQVSKAIRDMCVFAVHNFLKDPPFAKMDLVSCRNVLIYMEPYLQKKALTTFHYALVPNGFLLLGKSETNSSVPDLFAIYGKNDKVFSRKDVPAKYMHVASQRSEQNFRDIDSGTKHEGRLADFQKTADDILLSKFTPAGVVVNEAMEIVHFRGATGAYLEPSPGKASLNLLKMIKEGLSFELRNILHKAKTEKEPAIRENIPVSINGDSRNITIEAIPLRNVIEPYYLVLFHDNAVLPAQKIKAAGRKSPDNKMDEKELRIQQLERELSQTREDMRTITEDQEAANEELQSANEELLSGSEELQSLNEEMETSKEELQSTNEELIVINQEMISLNEQVTEARNYAEAIITTIKEALIILDKNLRVKTANHSFYRTFMASETETEGRFLFDLGNGQWDIRELRKMLENIIPDKERFADYEVRQSFPNIGERIMLLNAREMMDEIGSEKLILLAIEDITEKRVAQNKLSESEKKFRTMADFVPQIIWTSGPGGTPDYFNRQWYDFTRFTEGKANPDWVSLLHEDDREGAMNAWSHSVKNEIPYQIEYRFKDVQSGNYRWFLGKASPIKDENGKMIKWVGSFTDINEQKYAADELLKAKEIAELSALRAEEAVRSKQQFLSNMSHEIRTPMNSIIGFTKVLLKTPLNEKQKDYLDAIELSGDVLIVLINDILDLAKVDAGKMIFEKIPFRLADTVDSILHLFHLKLKEKNIELEKRYDPLIPAVLSGDPIRLHQIILNLMSNAVKFTSRGKITVDVRMLDDDDKKATIEFSITDTGMGIPEDKLSMIFEIFQQVHADNIHQYGGTGLGLSIVKKLLESQGGTIQVKSKIKVGSTFTFILNFQKTYEEPPVVENALVTSDSHPKNIKVLVAEDVPLNQLLMKTLLSDFGFDYDIVSNGRTAVEKLTADAQESAYDIVLMDLQMPEMNGFEATAYIRNELRSDIPVIAITADVTPEDIEKCKAVGMNDYISKPIDEKLLFTRIANLLKAREPVKESIPAKAGLLSEPGNITDLTYLKNRTKSDPLLMKELIRIYLEQTPLIVSAMKESIESKDWTLLKGTAHKLLPSFVIMGIDSEYQNMTKTVMEYAGNEGQFNAIKEMVLKIDSACKQACIELETVLTNLNSQ